MNKKGESKWFGRKNVIVDGSEDRIQEVPGSLGTTLFNVLGLLVSGHHFYREKRNYNRSTIFKVNIYKPRVVLCNYDSFRHLYENSHVRKEASFGMFTFNYKVLGDNTPLIFENGEEHDKRRQVFIELTKMLFCNKTFLQNVDKDVENEMRELAKNLTAVGKGGPMDFEDAVANAVNNVVTVSIIGKQLDHELVKAWMDNCLIKKFKKGRPEASGIYEKLRSAIQQSEKYQQFCEHVVSLSDVKVEDICNDLMFALIFNAYKALHAIVVSSLAHLPKLPQEDLNLLKAEALRFHQSSDKSAEFETLENIENFTLEMFRLFPPASFVFRRVTENFVMSLNTGNYQIRKDDLLCGNVYLCQRDPDIFENPDKVDIHRYTTYPRSKDYLTCFGAPFLQENVPGIHKCAGQKLALTLAKIFICHCLQVDIEFGSKTVWSGKKVKRIIGTDKPVKIKRFQYREVEELKKD